MAEMLRRRTGRTSGRRCGGRATVTIAIAVALALIAIAALAGAVWRVRGPLRSMPSNIGLDPAVSAIVVEAESGEVLFEQNADRRIPPASLAKLMTVLLAVEAVEGGQASMLNVVTVSRRAASMGGSQVWLGAGERYTLGQLLESVMIASANDSAVAVAEHLAGSERQFVGLMMKRANELGMRSTRFVNASGLPAEQGEGDGYTTASDMACLAREALGHQVIPEWSSTRSKAFRNHPLLIMNNTNPLLGKYPGCDGLKTGHTKAAGYHLIATARADGVRLVAAIMHAGNEEARATGCARLLDYGFAALRVGDTARSTAEPGARKPGSRDPGVR